MRPCDAQDLPTPGPTLFVFFFQAEAGIRDVAVTGVQTCALPISCKRERCGPEWTAKMAQSLAAANTWIGLHDTFGALYQIEGRFPEALREYEREFEVTGNRDSRRKALHLSHLVSSNPVGSTPSQLFESLSPSQLFLAGVGDETRRRQELQIGFRRS